jgi:hypothetical protein
MFYIFSNYVEVKLQEYQRNTFIINKYTSNIGLINKGNGTNSLQNTLIFIIFIGFIKFRLAWS